MSSLKSYKDKKIAIYGGSFNPIHLGHLLTGYDVIEKLGYDYVLYIPANIPVHKDFKDGIDSKLRLKMVQLAINQYDKFGVSDIEIKRGGLTYTYDTVLELQKRYGFKEKLGIVFGDDLLSGLHTWKNIATLQDMTELICLKRDDNQVSDSPYKIRYLNNRVFSISSTEIRDRIKNGLPINYFLPKEVYNFITNNKLYMG